MNHRSVNIGKRPIGDDHPVYIVFEAGPTHDGIETAKKLVDIAISAGADAIKFQILDAEKIVAGPQVQFSYTCLVDRNSGETEEVSESLLEILKRREMTFKEWDELIIYCEKREIEFFSTATNEDELIFLAEHDVNTIKICSGDVNYHHFLKQAAKYNWTLQLDTGLSSIGEIEVAVDLLDVCGCKDIIINHCPSGYPARLEGINLRVIPTLREIFPYPIAFSDHSPGMEMDIAAVALGANMIEKTITLDRTIRSP
ncbi:MAG: N-acetylneuraminate synthase family protein, partial [Deltaproteobacteria bacterium]|nr:N-acetylneuraminate synthase family protein [Deltaproteobacteria bacterium]